MNVKKSPQKSKKYLLKLHGNIIPSGIFTDMKNVYNILSENEKMNIPDAQFYDNFKMNGKKYNRYTINGYFQVGRDYSELLLKTYFY